MREYHYNQNKSFNGIKQKLILKFILFSLIIPCFLIINITQSNCSCSEIICLCFNNQQIIDFKLKQKIDYTFIKIIHDVIMTKNIFLSSNKILSNIFIYMFIDNKYLSKNSNDITTFYLWLNNLY